MLQFLPAAISVGSKIIEGIWGGKEEQQNPEFLMAPEYEEAEGARSTLWSKLQDWGNDPYYGAVEQPWQDIWQQAMDNVRSYYSGTATTPGTRQKLAGDIALRGMSDSPAATRSMTRLAAEENKNISDLAVQQSIAQAQFGEQARRNWLSNVYGLSNQKPAGTWYTPPAEQNYNWANMIGDIGSSIGGNMMQNSLMQNSMAQQYFPQSANSSYWSQNELDRYFQNR